MSKVDLDNNELRRLVTEAVLAADFRRATFAGVHRERSCPWVRVAIRPILIRNERHLQFAYFDARKNVTKNFQGGAISAHLNEVLDAGFARIHLSTGHEEVDIQTTKKGKILVGRRQVQGDAAPLESHNRTKNHPLAKADRLLQIMGIMSADGHIRATQRAKYTQINELLKQLTHVLDEEWIRSLGRPVEILDCGCGSSYLTLAVHHYLNETLGIPALIQGVDVNEEVIRKSIERGRHAGAEQVQFSCGRIGAVTATADIVLALHACDTATDEAIAQAVRSQAKILLCVPCCHHHLNDQLHAEGTTEVLRPMLRHGILQQRTADLITDSFRALALRIMGYRTDVVEFVSVEHTARNLMIRAVAGLPIGESTFVREYEELRGFWNVTPYIEKALGEPFQQLLTRRVSEEA